MNKVLKLKAFELRKLGKSYNEIYSELKVSKSTLSNWFSKTIWSQEMKKKLSEKVRKMQTEGLVAFTNKRRDILNESYRIARIEAKADFEKYKNDPFFMHVLGLYWGEGNKLGKSHVRISNSDVHIMRLYKLFLEKYFNKYNKRIRASLLIYPDLEAQRCIDYWSKKINLNKSEFTKCTVINGKEANKKRLQYGVCILGFSSRFLKEKMLEWLRLMELYEPN